VELELNVIRIELLEHCPVAIAQLLLKAGGDAIVRSIARVGIGFVTLWLLVRTSARAMANRLGATRRPRSCRNCRLLVPTADGDIRSCEPSLRRTLTVSLELERCDARRVVRDTAKQFGASPLRDPSEPLRPSGVDPMGRFSPRLRAWRRARTPDAWRRTSRRSRAAAA
jgi:hypothetical protein